MNANVGAALEPPMSVPSLAEEADLAASPGISSRLHERPLVALA